MKSTIEVTHETVRLSIEIPKDAELKVENGAVVRKGEVLAVKSNLEVQYKLAQSLQVKPEMVQGLLKKQVGEQVQTGDILAEKKGMWQVRRVPSQVSGVISKLIDGVIYIQVPQQEMTVTSPVTGKVVEITALEMEIEVEVEVIVAESSMGGRTWGELMWLDSEKGKGLENVRGDFRHKIVVMDGGLQKGVWFKLCALEIAGLVCPKIPEELGSWREQQHEEQLPVVIGSAKQNFEEVIEGFTKELKEWFNRRMGRVGVIEGEGKKIAVVSS